jgi:chromosome segregation ATPase
MSLGKELRSAEARVKELEKHVADADQVAAKASEEIAAMRSSADAAAKAAGEQIASLTAEIEKAKADLAAAQAKLTNPAFADAAAQGEKQPVQAAAEPSDAIKPASLYAEYAAITYPEARTRFWDAHEQELRAEARALAGIVSK